LTRFSRVTFNAAHNYLGLTTEVLRTEKAINDIACHPLPPSFYEGGGMRQLRQRFDGVSIAVPGGDSDYENDSDYFSYPSSSKNSSRSSLNNGSKADVSAKLPTEKAKERRTSNPFRSNTARQQVQAGDLLTSAARSTEALRPHLRSRSSVYTPAPTPSSMYTGASGVQRLSKDDFDLRDEVMSCIAKSIGLLQPPLSGEESVEASPAFPPSDVGRSKGVFGTSFGSLSLLEMGDDASSSMTGSTSSGRDDGYLSGLDNEVEILYFPAGSLLAKAGERNTGLFYVIEGFLDILLPEPTGPDFSAMQTKSTQQNEIRSSALRTESPAIEKHSTTRPAREHTMKDHSPKPLFTVKPGGIAGYLCKWAYVCWPCYPNAVLDSVAMSYRVIR
jgi:lysophospholipid hydrolase